MPSPQPTPDVRVVRSARRRKTAQARREGDTIVVLVPASVSRAEEQRLVEDLVARVLSRERRTRAPRGDAELRARADRLARRWLVAPDGSVALPTDVRWVGTMTKRWGSCTPATGVIRISDVLQPMPTHVVDYVLIHELAHLRVPGHDPAFRALVDAYPEAARARGYLEGWADARRLEIDEDHDTAEDAGDPQV